MRRSLATLLLLLLALPLVAPALGQPAQKQVMLCCLRGGAHHCVASATTQDAVPAPTLRAHCPACTSVAVTAHAADWIIDGNQLGVVSASSSSMRLRQVEAGYRITLKDSHHKRGPPTIVRS